MGLRRGGSQVVLIALALLAPACLGVAASPLAEVISSAPNRLNPWAGAENPLPPMETLLGVDQQFWVPVGPPEASLSVSVVEPMPQGTAPRGTILVLHGVWARSATMLPAATALAKAGYRAVLVDLRGCGRSTGQFLTYGVQESVDISQVIDELQRRGLLAGRIGLYGISYGATTSILTAGRDPRVQAVVAVEPFSTARDEIPHFARVLAPGVGWMIPEETYQRSLDEAGQMAQFNPDASNAIQAIQQTKAPVLIIHGKNDWLVPHWHGQRLQAAAPDHSQLISIPLLGHVALWFDPGGQVAQHSRVWFDRWLSEP